MSNLVKDILVVVWILLFSTIAGLSYLNINKTEKAISTLINTIDQNVVFVKEIAQGLTKLDQITVTRFNRVSQLLDTKNDKK